MEKLLLHFVLMAAGKGSRFGAETNKLLVRYENKPVISYLLENLLNYCRQTPDISRFLQTIGTRAFTATKRNYADKGERTVNQAASAVITASTSGSCPTTNAASTSGSCPTTTAASTSGADATSTSNGAADKTASKLASPRCILTAEQAPTYNASLLHISDYAAQEQNCPAGHIKVCTEYHWHIVCQPEESAAFTEICDKLSGPLLKISENNYASAAMNNLFIHTRKGSINRQAGVARTLQECFAASVTADLTADGAGDKKNEKLKNQHTELYLIHDAARTNLSAELLDNLISCALANMTAIPYLPVSDTILQLHGNDTANGKYLNIDTLKRSELIAVQTPQVFNGELLRELYATLPSAVSEPDFYAQFTDDSSLFYRYSPQREFLTFCLGTANNNKLTYASDLRKIAKPLP